METYVAEIKGQYWLVGTQDDMLRKLMSKKWNTISEPG
jgi:hypothetical protein